MWLWWGTFWMSQAHLLCADTPTDYANYPAYCTYYDWDMRSGGDIGNSKALWDWIGGSDNFDCGFSSASSMASFFSGSRHGLRLAVRSPPGVGWKHAATL